jgi:hypothetical protein
VRKARWDVLVPITPCRILDTRTGAAEGPRHTPLGSGETYDVTGRGASTGCPIPTTASGVALNVTAIDATSPTYLTIWATGAARPNASHLNPSPGQPPTPNAVTTDLSAGGQFSVYNAIGTVNVLVDVIGYYEDHNHDDRYYTRAQVDSRTPVAAGTISAAGTVLNGTGITSVTWNAAISRYEITLTGQSYNLSSYATVVTPVCSNFPLAEANSVSGNLLVTFRNTGGTAGQCLFHFVSFKLT